MWNLVRNEKDSQITLNKSEHNKRHKTATRILWLTRRVRTYQKEHIRKGLLKVVAVTLAFGV